jgi:hypothetical protein
MILDTIVHHLHTVGVPFRLSSYPSEEAEPKAGHRIPPNAMLVETRLVRVGGKTVLACFAAGDTIDLPAIGAALGGAAAPGSSDDLPEEFRKAEPSPPPLGQLLGMPVVVDDRVAVASVLVFRVSPGSDYVEVPFADFARAEQPRLAAIAHRPKPARRAEAARGATARPPGLSFAAYDLVPVDGRWLIQMAGDSQSEIADSKATAIARARELGARYAEWKVRVYTDAGTLETEISSAVS